MDLRGFDPEVLERFEAYDWPGNVRELQGAIKQAMVNASGHLIRSEFLAETLLKTSLRETAVIADFPNVTALIARLLPDEDGQLYDRVFAAVERVLFTQVLEYAHGNQGRACELLGVNRSTLRHRLRKLGLVVDKIPAETPKKEPRAGN
jgi:two-component system, NtrC family, nitrogen regulation response regulator GlnG